MARILREALAERIIIYYKTQAVFDKLATYIHFREEGIPKRTIYNAMARFDKTGESKYKKVGGSVRSEINKRKIKTIGRIYKKNPSSKVRLVAKKVRLPVSTTQFLKKKVLNIKAYSKQSQPKYIKDQKKRAKTGCLKIYKKVIRKMLIIDDETYMPFDPQDVPGKTFFHASNPEDVNYSEKVKPKAKFTKKYMIWLAIAENGQISEPFITDQKMDGDMYFRECIQARLIPFLSKFEINNILFWPDMATVHYTKNTTDELKAQKINFVEKTENAPNVPQARGIERYWALCKMEYARRSKPPKSLQGFKRIMGRILREVAEKSGIAVMTRARKNLIKIGYKGIDGAGVL